MDIQCFADALSDGHSWIERVERILENHLKLPPKRAECAGTECGDVLSVEHDSAARGLQKTQDGPSEGAFAAAAFADQAHGFPAATFSETSSTALTVNGAPDRACRWTGKWTFRFWTSRSGIGVGAADDVRGGDGCQ